MAHSLAAHAIEWGMFRASVNWLMPVAAGVVAGFCLGALARRTRPDFVFWAIGAFSSACGIKSRIRSGRLGGLPTETSANAPVPWMFLRARLRDLAPFVSACRDIPYEDASVGASRCQHLPIARKG